MSDRTFAEAAQELGLPQTWLKKKVQARAIPHTRYGKYVRFTDADLAAIREKHAEAPIAAPSRNVVQMRRRSA